MKMRWEETTEALRIKLHRVGSLKSVQVTFFVVLSVWVLWHVVTIYHVYKEPVRITTKPLGYTEITDGKVQAFSYLRLKNDTFTSKQVCIRLYLMDSYRKEQEYEITSIEKWGSEKGKETKVDKDLIIIPGRTEVGLYVEGERNYMKDITFPYHTEQVVSVAVKP